jgi:hypothetical protein
MATNSGFYEQNKFSKQNKNVNRKNKKSLPNPPQEYSFDDFLSDVGNDGMQKLFGALQLQAKMNVSQPGDAYEREADRIADSVVSGDAVQVGKIHKTSPLQKNGSSSRSIIPPFIEARIAELKGNGSSLHKGLKEFFEPRFGVDLDKVRIHNDSKANRLSQAVHAKAFTHGNDIAFAQGQFQPETMEGKKLIAHELAHVEQQRSDLSSIKKNQLLLRKKGEDTIHINRIAIGNHLAEENSIWVVLEFENGKSDINSTREIPKAGAYPRRLVYIFNDTEILPEIDSSFNYMSGIGWETDITDWGGSLFKIRYGRHESNTQFTFEVSDSAHCSIESVGANSYSGERLLFKVSGTEKGSVASPTESTESASTLSDDQYLDYWIIERLNTGDETLHTRSLADLKASEKTFVKRFGDADTFYSKLKSRFKTLIENKITDQAAGYGIPLRLAKATWWTESGLWNGQQYVFPRLNTLWTNGTGVGCMQVEYSAHPEWGQYNLMYSWTVNIHAGMDYLAQAYKKAERHFAAKQLWVDKGETEAEVLARSSYAMYNAGLYGNSYARPWDQASAWRQNDVNLLYNYTNQGW